MFEITYGQISNPNFIKGLQKIIDTESTDFNKAYNLARAGKLIEQHQKEAHKVQEKLFKSHGEADGEGNYVIPQEKRQSWDKALEDWKGHKIKVERHKIRVGDIEGVPLAPSEILALEPLLDGLDTVGDNS